MLVHEKRRLYIAFGILTAGMLAFSQTQSCYWDEGFNILAARLIRLGKRPYLDFFFPQTPLNAYWNAGWMALFGPSWRAVHAIATLATLGSIALLVQYLYAMFPNHRWQSAAAFTGLALFGLHMRVWATGTIAQAYPLCLLLLVAAFRAAIAAVAQERFAVSVLVAGLTGLLASAAAAASLLTVLAAPVLLIWMWTCNRAGSRWVKAAAFLAGAVVAYVPVLVLLVRSPHQTIFNILTYQALYRRAGWDGATSHDIGVVTGWLVSSPDLLLVVLAIAGLLFLRQSGLDAARRSEIYLCVALALALGAQNALAHPTFPMYFVFMIPFLAVPAAMGLYAVVAQLKAPIGPWPAVLGILAITGLCLGQGIYEDRGLYTWPELEQVAAETKRVTPPGASLLAPEQIYFLTEWPVPLGMEFHHALRLQLPAAENAAFHVLSQGEVDQETKAGAFSTAVVCDDPDQTRAVRDWHVYTQSAEVQECTIFWQPTKLAQPIRGAASALSEGSQ